MSGVFFDELGLPEPDVNLGVGSGTHSQQTGRVMEAYEALLLKQRPDLVVVVGDVNATPAAALAAVKLGIRTAHREAGLRAFDRSMPEEINRIVTDAVCDELWTPSPDADANLLREGIPEERVKRVGNIMIDALEMLRPRIASANLPDTIRLCEGRYAVVTLHRPSNVDSPDTLSLLCSTLRQCAETLPFVFPLHPRTRVRLEEAGLLLLEGDERIHLIPPQPYCAFMRLVMEAASVVTDSGGIQEETSYLGIPCLTLRRNTERPITVTMGTNQLVEPEALPSSFAEACVARRKPANIALWDGKTASRITRYLGELL